MVVVGIDPGTTHTALVALDNGRVAMSLYLGNLEMLLQLRYLDRSTELVAIEMIASYGMPVGKEVFETCVWIGRYIEALRDVAKPQLIYRKDIKLHLCGQARAKDANVRQALIDRYGPGKDIAIGRKASPGPLYGVSGDLWAALAVAVTMHDMNTGKRELAA